MKLDPKSLTKSIHQLFTNQTVPEYAFRGISDCKPIGVTDLADIVSKDTKNVITRASQLAAFEEDARSQCEGVMLFSGVRFPTRPRQAAILFLASQIKFGFLQTQLIQWHRMDYDTKPASALTFKPQCLIIDSVYPNSTPVSVEKIRTLLYKLDPSIAIILGAGACPLTLAHEVLFVDVARTMKFP